MVTLILHMWIWCDYKKIRVFFNQLGSFFKVIMDLCFLLRQLWIFFNQGNYGSYINNFSWKSSDSFDKYKTIYTLFWRRSFVANKKSHIWSQQKLYTKLAIPQEKYTSTSIFFNNFLYCVRIIFLFSIFIFLRILSFFLKETCL